LHFEKIRAIVNFCQLVKLLLDPLVGLCYKRENKMANCGSFEPWSQEFEYYVSFYSSKLFVPKSSWRNENKQVTMLVQSWAHLQLQKMTRNPNFYDNYGTWGALWWWWTPSSHTTTTTQEYSALQAKVYKHALTYLYMLVIFLIWNVISLKFF
jgi:hypothetical protein